ncbi:hypothetical protein LPW41_11690 [Microbacterium sp. JC 701]|uniref:hypothetical protein n=1 Tax=Microbacterium sp. JC 701 TaxID=2897389 RepID=UPI001E538FBB|nr:hypothetical protein [Microbacterium sp. JC 701]MCD2170359.1 hypothetical protein [Microbacterium sp. JC 701]
MKINGALPKGNADGISHVETRVIQSRKMIAAVVMLDPASIDEDVETSEKSVRMRVRRIEAILPEDVDAATRLLRRAFEQRTGQVTLPIEVEEDLDEALRGVQFDAATGEVVDEEGRE